MVAPKPIVLDDASVEKAAKMVVASEDAAESLSFFQASLPESEVTKIEERVQEIRSAKSFALMSPKLKKDVDNKKAIELHGLLEKVSSLLVELTDEKENRVGGGSSLEHYIKKIPTAQGVISVVVKTGEKE